MRAGPSRTAELVCFFRALEQRRPVGERILDDPFAETFLSRAYRAALRAPLPDLATGGLAAHVCARGAFIDGWLRRSLEEGTEQVVLLGAGYDTRAWRLADVLGDRPVYEVDHPSTQERKARLAASLPPSPARLVGVDFERDAFDERLRASGLRADRPTFFVWEGVSMYLTEDAVRRTLDAVSALAAPGSRIAVELLAGRELTDPLLAPQLAALLGLRVLGEPVRFRLPPAEAEGLVGPLGWAVEDVADGLELRRRHVPAGRLTVPATWMLAARREA